MSEEKKVNKNGKQPNKFIAWVKNAARTIARKAKETWSELKKVTWPTFPKVVKQTGIVLGVIIVFLVLITAFDYGFQALLSLINN